MRKAINQGVLGPLPLAGALPLVKQAGFEGIELNLPEEGLNFPADQLPLEPLQLFALPVKVIKKGLDPALQLGRTALQPPGNGFQEGQPLPQEPLGPPGRNCLDAPQAGPDAAFGNHPEDPDLAGVVHVGAAAKLKAKGRLPDPDGADDFAVFFAEEGDGPLLDGLLEGHKLRDNGQVLPDLFVNQALNLLKFGPA